VGHEHYKILATADQKLFDRGLKPHLHAFQRTALRVPCWYTKPSCQV
jgi:hypothetical protein